MNIDKTLILVGILLGSILVVENMVTGLTSYVFLSTSSSAGILSLVSILVGMMIGYGMRGKAKNGNKNDIDDGDDYDF